MVFIRGPRVEEMGVAHEVNIADLEHITDGLLETQMVEIFYSFSLLFRQGRNDAFV